MEAGKTEWGISEREGEREKKESSLREREMEHR
jgi:hypothetical protein